MISALCIALSAGAATLVLPTKTITLSWVHSVEQTPWEEDYTIEQNDLILEEARIKRSGAGMDPPGEAIWRDSWWLIDPRSIRCGKYYSQTLRSQVVTRFAGIANAIC